MVKSTELYHSFDSFFSKIFEKTSAKISFFVECRRSPLRAVHYWGSLSSKQTRGSANGAVHFFSEGGARSTLLIRPCWAAHRRSFPTYNCPNYPLFFCFNFISNYQNLYFRTFSILRLRVLRCVRFRGFKYCIFKKEREFNLLERCIRVPWQHSAAFAWRLWSCDNTSEKSGFHEDWFTSSITDQHRGTLSLTLVDLPVSSAKIRHSWMHLKRVKNHSMMK